MGPRKLAVILACAAAVSSVPPRASSQAPAGTDYSAVDAHALAAPASAASSFKSLASWLTSSCRSDEEKARAIFRWITQNIDYDVSAFLSGQPMSGDAADALRTRKGVCEGYAGLFTELARASGLKVASISGFAKGYGYAAGQPLGDEPNHSWNAVSINGRWRLMDCTWGAGYIGDDRTFHRSFDPHFFLTPPGEFIYDHFPEHAQWQLLDSPLSREQFERAVYVKPGFFHLGLTLGGNTEGTLSSPGEIVIRLGTSRAVAGIASLLSGAKSVDERSTFVQNESGSLVIRATPPGTGTHTLRVFAKEQGEAGAYGWILDYRIASSARPNGLPAYPRKFSAFDEGRVRLIAPLSGILPAGGSPQTFRLIIPRAEQAAVVVNDNWTMLGRTGEEMKGEVAVRGGTITICAKYPGHEEWDTLLEYTGR